MLPKGHLNSHSRMSGSRWVIKPWWLSGSWRSFLYSSSVYSYHLFLISSPSVRSTPFLSFIVPIFAWNVSLVSLILLLFSISLQWSLRKAFLSLLPVLWTSAFKWVYLSFSPFPFTSLHFITVCKASSDSYFAFLHEKPWCIRSRVFPHSNGEGTWPDPSRKRPGHRGRDRP